jgi:hypothetical protein
MATFSVIMEMVPGEAHARMVEPIEADNIDHAWELARKRWYNSPLEEQHRKTVMRGSSQISVTPQIVDIKEGEYTLPEVMQAPLDLVAEAIAQKAETEVELEGEPEAEPVPHPEQEAQLQSEDHSVRQPE